MKEINSTDFGAAIKRGLKGAYFLYGQEEYLKERCVQSARESVLGGGDRFFNHCRINGSAFSADRLSEEIQALPVMAERRLVEVSGVDFRKMKEDEFGDVCAVLKSIRDNDQCVVLIITSPDEFDAGTQKYPSKALKALSEVAVPVEFPRETPARLNKWVIRHFAAEGVIASPEQAAYLIGLCGVDMFILASETEKLSAYVLQNGRERLTEEDIAFICSPVNEIDTFDFANAVLERNSARAFNILSDMKLRGEKPELILGSVSRVMCDLMTVKALSDAGSNRYEISSRLTMHEYKAGLYISAASKLDTNTLNDAVKLCAEADVKLKSSAADKYAVLELLIAGTVA